MESRSPKDVVLALVRVINRDSPLRAADELLDPAVQIYMDSTNYCGINIWYKWIHFIRNCGRVSDLRMTRCEAMCGVEEPQLVRLSVRWSGAIRPGRLRGNPAGEAQLRYLVQDGCIKKIWTRKSNYEFIFGPWIKYSVGFRFLVGWFVLYFAILALRGKNISRVG